MAKQISNNSGSEEMDATTTPPVDTNSAPDERPNRTAFSKRFAKRHADIDFEDKEARYGAMNDDADALSKYEENGRALSDMLGNNKWLAAMVVDCTREKMHPLEWMASQGIDIRAALDDDEIAKKVADQITRYQEKIAEQEKHSEELNSNLQKSYENLVSLGLSDDEVSDLYKKVWGVIGDAENGMISTDTWKLFKNAYSYDDDIASARSESAMQARNEKIQNPLRSSVSEGMPPSLSSSAAGNAPAKQSKKKKSSFFEGLTD